MVIEQGDVVQLRSVGPEMTVSWVQELYQVKDGEQVLKVYIHTKWFDVHGICHEGSFREEMIKYIN